MNDSSCGASFIALTSARQICCRYQRGQAVTEFVVMCLVAIPLFLGVMYVAKYADAKYTAVQASRYLAWERSVDPSGAKSNGRLQQEMAVRIVGNGERNGGKLRDDDYSKSNSNSDDDYNPMWFDHAQNRMLNRLTDVSAANGPQNSGVPGATGLFGTVQAKAMGLNQKGWIKADAEIPFMDVTQYAPLSNVQFKAGATNVMLVDNWGASGASDVIGKVQRAAPETLVFTTDPIKSAVQLIRDTASFFEDSFSEFYPGCIAPDVVPTDRLKNYSGYSSCRY
ncbi:MAG TPA: hypothetical protein VF427_05885 [Noviherbaspirillum sp.]